MKSLTNGKEKFCDHKKKINTRAAEAVHYTTRVLKWNVDELEKLIETQGIEYRCRKALNRKEGVKGMLSIKR